VHFYVLYNAYVEWQKTVKSPIGPEPTHSNALGKLLTSVGFGAHETKTSTDRTLPDLKACQAALFAPKESERMRPVRRIEGSGK